MPGRQGRAHLSERAAPCSPPLCSPIRRRARRDAPYHHRQVVSTFFHTMFDPARWAVVPFHFWSVMIFIFGCIVGSFLNVVIHRLPLGQSVVSPPSHCPHCKYSIPWYLNIPL